jgi:polyphosphate glucokinase
MPAKRKAARKRARGPLTLAIDIGGTGIKAIALDALGKPVTDRSRVDTPRPATPKKVIAEIRELAKKLGRFDRVSVGFPGVVQDGVTRSAPNLHSSWKGFALERVLQKTLGKPVRALNDAGVQGFGVIEGRGLELVITLGTGMGCAIYIDGCYVPNLELAHHPLGNGKTYEDYVGNRALERHGKRKWNKRVAQIIEQIDPIWNPRRIYLGGGNAKHLKLKLPKHVEVTQNVSGLLGGIALWR